MHGFIHFCVGNTFFMDIYQPHGGVHRSWFFKETARYEQPLRSLVRFIKRLSLKDTVQRLMEWWAFKVARPRVIAISEMVANDMARFFQYPKERIHLVPNGVDLDTYDPKNRVHREAVRQGFCIDSDDFVFLFVAQNPKLKGYDVLIDACIRLLPLPFKVLVVGPYDSGMKRKAEPLGGRVLFAGKSRELARIYPACDCLVHPTYYDACSLVVLESLASGVPVITTNANGASMYLDDSNGSVIDPGDASGLSEAMKNMMVGPRGRISIGSLLKNHHTVFSLVEGVMASHEP